jgi:hypothetical protein
MQLPRKSDVPSSAILKMSRSLSKDENKIITKLSPFILEKWLKSTVGEVRNVTKMKSGSLLVECYRQQQSINLLS